jgi:Tol biopolymer transport system component/DNA-binding winged helix-turn-helix (wHTH) protein
VSDGIVTEFKPFVFKFDGLEVRSREFAIIRDGAAIPVEPKAFRVLLFLLQNPGRLVTKDELVKAAWDDTSVSDNSLTRSIATLRRLLGDDAREPRYIATVQTVGYRFVQAVEVSEAPPGPPDPNHTPPAQNPATDSPGVIVRSRLKWLVSVACLAAIVIVGVWFAKRWIGHHAGRTIAERSAADQPPSSRLRIVPFTNLPGAVWDPAFSPDGRQIAFFWNGENHGKGDLFIQLVGGGNPLRLTHSSGGYPRVPSWSPDGREIAFARCDDNGGAIYVVPALGGPERKVTDTACTYGVTGFPNWTRDGRSLVIADRCSPTGPISIMILSLDTALKRCLTTPPPDGSDFAPVLSPDQQTVAFLRWPSDIYTVPIAGGSARRLTEENKAIWALMWTLDGKHISFISARSGLEKAWRVSAAGGAIEPETQYPGVGALSSDGTRLAYVDPPGFAHSTPVIWRADLSGAGGTVLKLRQLSPPSADNSAPQPSPDGHQIAFESTRSGNSEVWKSNADGSDPIKLTSFDGLSGTPRWSPDGKWIAFDSRTSVHNQIYLIDREGRNLHQLTQGNNNHEAGVPSWSRNGKAIYFASDRGGVFQIWRHDLASGGETQMTHNGGLNGFESYDGGTLYFSKFDKAGIWSVPVSGGEEQRITDVLHLGYWGHFAVMQDGLYLIDSDADRGPTVMYYSFQTRRMTPVFTLKEGYDAAPWRASLGVSRDGRTVFFVQGTYQSSIILAENFH